MRRSREGRDIAIDYPPAGDLARRAACERRFLQFCETYFPAAFSLPWSEDHLRIIATIERCVLEGGLFALAMPRGSGKTTLCERAALWALLYGHRRFVCLIGATEQAAAAMLDNLKTELQFNELLAEDFRNVCYPIRCLEGNARRCIGQLFDGQQTRIDWSAKRLTLPTMPDAACDGVNVSGATVTVAGLTGALRGQSHTLASGEVIRPELVILDDPQTRESAMSPAQSAQRVAIIEGDVLGMAGPGRRIAALLPCTVIRGGDAADVLLDRQQHPRWQGERCKLLYAIPTDSALWEKYAEIRADSFRRGDDGRTATDFYKTNRDAMDAGAKPAWPARFNEDEASAIQHAMNLRIDDEAAFQAEYQNTPVQAVGTELATMTATEIAAKVSGVPRGAVPVGTQHVTAFIDVHDSLLFYTVTAWAANFTGHIIDYGTFPDLGPSMNRRTFTLRQAEGALGNTFPGTGKEGAIRAGLDALADAILRREWPGENGTAWRIGLCLVDAGYTPAVVQDFCRYSQHAAVLMSSRGVGIGAANRPMHEYHQKRGDRFGLNWYIPGTPTAASAATATANAVRTVRFDANYWKTFTHTRLAALGDKGCLSLWGHHPDDHRQFADHVAAEAPVRTFGQGRTVDEWRLRPGVTDNHYLDCLTGCAVAGSILGATLAGMTPTPPRRERKRYTQEDLMRKW